MEKTRFQELQSRIARIGLEHHAQTILENSRSNAAQVRKTIRDCATDVRQCIVIGAGPSLYREHILPRIVGYRGTIVAAEGSYIQCIKAGIIPDWVITIDPSPRIVRWFGERFEDDYFKRQDLDIGIREEAENRRLIDENKVPLVICTSAPQNVVERTAAFDRYWFAPLVDSLAPDSLTRQMCEATGCPALNTGGTVGTAAYIFARQCLGTDNIAVVGMDFGYYADTPLEQTQEWNMLKDEPNVHDFYPVRNGHWGAGYTSPTYAWYMQNFLDLLDGDIVVNCSGGGFLRGPGVDCMEIEEWLKSCS